MKYDALNRSPIEKARETELIELFVLGIKISIDWVAIMQCDSKEILNIHDKLEQRYKELMKNFQ